MLRKGVIYNLSLSKGIGVIMDENLQDITFSLEDACKGLKIHEKVTFSISQTNHGLRAVKLKKIIAVKQRIQ